LITREQLREAYGKQYGPDLIVKNLACKTSQTGLYDLDRLKLAVAEALAQETTGCE
jgi:hypothetical protein